MEIGQIEVSKHTTYTTKWMGPKMVEVALELLEQNGYNGSEPFVTMGGYRLKNLIFMGSPRFCVLYQRVDFPFYWIRYLAYQLGLSHDVGRS